MSKNKKKRLTVLLYSSLRTGRFAEKEICCLAEPSIGQIIRELGIDQSEAGVVLLNGKPASCKDIAFYGCKVEIYPLIGGG